MFLFLKLALAHLIADFILQFEELYRLKVKSHAGHFFHAAIHAGIMILLAAPYFPQHPFILLYLVILAKIHYFQDEIKYRLQAKHPKQIFWCFTIDQMFHFLFLATCFFFPDANNPPAIGNPVLDQLYRDNLWTLYACAFIATTFKLTYTLHAFRLSFIPGSRPLHFITSPEVAWDLIERSWITGWMIIGPFPWNLAAALPIGILRFLNPLRRDMLDFVLSAGAAVGMGLLFRHWISVLA